MIAEMFEESIVLLAQLLKVALDDVTYIKLNAMSSSKKAAIPNQAAEDRLKRLLEPSYHVYDFFKERLKKRIEMYGNYNMTRDVETLAKLNQAEIKRCGIISMVRRTFDILSRNG